MLRCRCDSLVREKKKQKKTVGRRREGDRYVRERVVCVHVCSCGVVFAGPQQQHSLAGIGGEAAGRRRRRRAGGRTALALRGGVTGEGGEEGEKKKKRKWCHMASSEDVPGRGLGLYEMGVPS